MAPTRDLSNKRVTVALGASNAVADTTLSVITLAEASAFLNVTPAIRWNGYAMGVQASDKVDDRSLADEAGSQIRGFNKFGGAVPFFYPKVTDTSSILRQTFNTVKTQRTSLIYLERVGWVDYSTPFAAGDTVNLYSILTDGFNPSTSGNTGYAYLQTFLANGPSNFYFVIPAATAAPLTLVGAATASISVGTNQAALRGVTYQGQDITPRATWTSSAPGVATVRDGVITPVSAGTATIVPSYAGAAVNSGIAVTVTA